MADKSELNKMLTEFAEFLGTENKTLADAITAKVDQLKQTIMGGEVDEELDTFRELIAEFKKLKTASGNTPEAILTKFTEIEQKITDLTGTVGTNKTTAETLANTAKDTADAAKQLAEEAKTTVADYAAVKAKAEAADVLSQANQTKLQTAEQKIQTIETKLGTLDIDGLDLEKLKQAYNSTRNA
jgi:chromosome segregation ATPase